MSQDFDEYAHFFEVRLDQFSGPIDLLLHLVKLNELPIEKLALAQVAVQYMECVTNAKRFDLEVAGEYLVIAATLLSIKSSLLLNEPVELIIDEDGNLVDPHEELLRKLREAEVYKEGAELLTKRDLLNVDVFAAGVYQNGSAAAAVRYRPHEAMLLGMAFRKLLKQSGDQERVFTIEVDRVSIVDRMMRVLKLLQEKSGPVLFDDLIEDRSSRAALIGAFLAMLELCKRQLIQVEQGDTFEVIYVSLVSTDLNVTGLTSEFDEEISPTEEVAHG